MPKRAKAAEVAKLAGVSRTTVSFVLNNVPGMRISEDTRQRVLEAARQLNYHPDATARRMVSGQTNQIGFILRSQSDQAFGDYFLSQVLAGLTRAAIEADYHILFEPILTEDDQSAYIRLISERHVDAIVLFEPRLDDLELLTVYAEAAPIVLIGHSSTTDIPSVSVNNLGAAKRVTQHLIELGHRRIAMIANASLAYASSQQRLAGYRIALEDAGIEFEDAFVRFGNFTFDSGYEAMNELLSNSPLPTAVFAASDMIAIGAFKAARERGIKIPLDLALSGFDDIPMAVYIDPQLTTVHLPAAEVGWHAADLAIRHVEKEEIPELHITLEGNLVVRESCGAR